MKSLFLLLSFFSYKKHLLAAAFLPSPSGLQQPHRPQREYYHPDGRRTVINSPLQGRTIHAAKAATTKTPTSLKMALDLVTYLRTEWISAALCTNQTPRAADVCLQLGTEDGRAVSFIPRTIRQLITSSAEADGKLTVAARRQLKQQQDRRENSAKITYSDQRADDLRETESESVDVVISLQAAARMMENGQDWKRSVREAARVLKPGGRLLFVEQTDLNGESYVDYIENLLTLGGEVIKEQEQASSDGDEDDEEDEETRFPIFDDIGYDDVDLVLTPHIAGVAVKSMDAGMSPAERLAKAKAKEKERLAEISIEAYERGIKKRRRKRKKKESTADEEKTASKK